MIVNYLGRTGMYVRAFEHILENDPNFPYKKEDFEKINKTRKYDPTKETTSPEWETLCKRINEWLNEHYIMIEIDYTHPEDDGSRDECVLCYEKKSDDIYYSPDFENELPKLVCYR